MSPHSPAAREGLRQAYLQEHVTAVPEGCAETRSRLGAYARGGLGKREKALVEAHLDRCDECPVVLAELRDVGHGMRAVIAPLVLGGAAASALLTFTPSSSAQASGVPRGPRARTLATAAAVAATAVVLVAAGAFAFAALSSSGDDAPVSPPAAQNDPPAASGTTPAPPRPSATPSSPPASPSPPATE